MPTRTKYNTWLRRKSQEGKVRTDGQGHQWITVDDADELDYMCYHMELDDWRRDTARRWHRYTYEQPTDKQVSRKSITRATRQGGICDVTTLNYEAKPHVRKLSKTEYVHLDTGEVREYMPSEGRNRRSLRKIFRDLRQTINNNYDRLGDRGLSVTLTYEQPDGQPMTDDKRVYNDYKAFYKRLRRAYPDHCFDYILVVEPQGSGSWHAHLLLKSTKSLYIDNTDMARLWGHGFTKTKRIRTGRGAEITNIGAYFSAYFANLELDGDKIHTLNIDPADIIERDGKRYIKGARLDYYPDYMQIWRHSRGIARPVAEIVAPEEIEVEFPHIVYERDHIIVQEGIAPDLMIHAEQRAKRLPPPRPPNKKKEL